jgi:hypothetical protein
MLRKKFVLEIQDFRVNPSYPSETELIGDRWVEETDIYGDYAIDTWDNNYKVYKYHTL